MNPMLAASLDWNVPEGAAWLAAYSAILGAGCCVICVIGFVLLLREALRALGSGTGSPTTWQAEFMGYGVAKEKVRPRPARNVRHSKQASAVAPALGAPTPDRA